MQVRYNYLDRQYQNLRHEILDAVDGIFQRSAFILRPEVAALESALASRLGASHAVGVNSGTDALYLGIEALRLPAGSEAARVRPSRPRLKAGSLLPEPG